MFKQTYLITLDTDLLYSGVILHDLGKVRELSGPIDTVYTLEGNLLGREELVNQPVSIQFQGHPISGVIEHVDDEHVYLLVAVDDQGQYIDYHSLLNQQQEEAHRQNRVDGYTRNPYMGPCQTYMM